MSAAVDKIREALAGTTDTDVPVLSTWVMGVCNLVPGDPVAAGLLAIAVPAAANPAGPRLMRVPRPQLEHLLATLTPAEAPPSA